MRSAAEMEEIVNRLISVPREALDYLLRAVDRALVELDHSGDLPAYCSLVQDLQRYGGDPGHLSILGAPEIAGALPEGRAAVEATLARLGLRE